MTAASRFGSVVAARRLLLYGAVLQALGTIRVAAAASGSGSGGGGDPASGRQSLEVTAAGELRVSSSPVARAAAARPEPARSLGGSERSSRRGSSSSSVVRREAAVPPPSKKAADGGVRKPSLAALKRTPAAAPKGVAERRIGGTGPASAAISSSTRIKAAAHHRAGTARAIVDVDTVGSVRVEAEQTRIQKRSSMRRAIAAVKALAHRQLANERRSESEESFPPAPQLFSLGLVLAISVATVALVVAIGALVCALVGADQFALCRLKKRPASKMGRPMKDLRQFCVPKWASTDATSPPGPASLHLVQTTGRL